MVGILPGGASFLTDAARSLELVELLATDPWASPLPPCEWRCMPWRGPVRSVTIGRSWWSNRLYGVARLFSSPSIYYLPLPFPFPPYTPIHFSSKNHFTTPTKIYTKVVGLRTGLYVEGVQDEVQELAF